MRKRPDKSSFNLLCGAVKHVEACLIPEKSINQFSPLWRPREVGASLFMCGKYLINQFHPPMRCCDARRGLFKYHRRSRKLFLPLWRPCEVDASLFMCGKDLIKPF